MKSQLQTFTAVLEADGTRLRWVIARLPFDIGKVWPVRRSVRVRGDINGFAFRTALFPDPGRGGRVLLVNKKMQAGAKATVGSRVKIRLEPDLEEREAAVPPELAKALKGDRRLRRWFDALGFARRKDIGKWVMEPKSAASRTKRAEQMAEWLLLALEGETETPPILKAAFLREPMAKSGWEAMTEVRRRNHLLGIFHLQSSEARERRAAAAVADAVQLARRMESHS